MRTTRRVLAVILLSALVLPAADKKSNAPAAMAEDKKIQHALNRFSFGPRPGDVERVRSIGLEKWFDQQLHPERIDDSALQARLAPFRTLRMSTREMVENFPPPQVVKALENRRISMPSDPGKRAIYETRKEAYEQRQEKKQAKGSTDSGADAVARTDATKNDAAMKMEGQDEEQMSPEQQKARQKQLENEMYAEVDTAQLLELPPEQRYQKIIKMNAEDRLIMARSVQGKQLGQQMIEGMKPEQRETIQAIVNPQLVVGGELAQSKILRAIYSERQLDEVMTDFWLNHFNIFIGKGPDRYMLGAYERDVIRPRALGRFKDLLVATAQSPAMLFYLDNWLSVGPESEVGLGSAPRPHDRRRRGANSQNRPFKSKKKLASGLNENYGRELMELQTLSVICG
jgi:hypothetical protein